ncbi:multiubiquitin domain-containing protein [Humisphaera borealis]|uniref:Multiubiquitin domain-containing protein n=1 Tax=Humisphaera borealis TaxID=2807512 RepID=A0A7M2X3B4_9BACT|nr:multiubiquitin domain-containing protein [Humisphaera borealis]QOV92119.1 multiubiquitin domain-containing protein [Humisphaera borealis]
MQKLEIDKVPFESADPVLTGRQILTLAGKQPVEEHLVFCLGPDRQLEDIDLEETVNLRELDHKIFITFRSDRSFNFELDGRRQPWGSASITETQLRWLAGIPAGYRVWQERRAQEDLLLSDGQTVPLEPKGVERFYTGKEDTNAGERCLVLPESDQRFLDDHDMVVEAVTDGERKGVVFKGFNTGGRFDHATTDVLMILPAGYPDACPDMFYCFPWIKLQGASGWPEKADVLVNFGGRQWQQWSRHNSDWRAGVDGIHTMIRRISAALRDTK